MEYFFNQGKKLVGSLTNIKSFVNFDEKQQQNLYDQINKLKQPPHKFNLVDVKLPGELQDKIKSLIHKPVLDTAKKEFLQGQLIKLKKSPTEYKKIYADVEKHLPGQLEAKFKGLMSQELINKQMIEHLQQKLYNLMKLPHLNKVVLTNLLANVNKLKAQPVLYKEALEKLNVKFEAIPVPKKDDEIAVAKLNADILKLIKPIKKLSSIKSESLSKSLSPIKQVHISPIKSPSPVRVKVVKGCPEGKIINPLTGRCIKIKEPKPEKEVKVKKVKEPKPEKEVKVNKVKEPKPEKEVKVKKVKEPKPLMSGYEMINGKMYKKCKRGQERNDNMRCAKVK